MSRRLGFGTGFCLNRVVMLGGGAVPITDNFRLEIDTTLDGTSGSNQFTLPLIAGESYNFVAIVDGVELPPQTTDVSPTYTFASAGLNTLEIKGATSTTGFSGVYFNDEGDKLKVLDISSWGTMLWTTFRNAFYGCANLVSITSSDPVPVSPSALTVENMFNNTSIVSLPSVFNTSNITNANGMLANTALTSLPSYSWASCKDFAGFLTGVTIDTTSYNSFLVELDSNALTDGVLDGGLSISDGAGEVARKNLVTKNWNVSDQTGLVINYKLDGTDAGLLRAGTDDFRIAPSCPEAIGSWNNGADQWNYSFVDSSIIGDIGSGDFSLSFWFNTTSKTNQDMFCNGNGAGSDTFRTRITSAGKVQFRITSSAVLSPSILFDGKWHHVAITINGSTGEVDMYIDNSLDAQGTIPLYALTDSNVIGIGALNSVGSNKMTGGMDDARLYNRILNQTEISNIYNNTCDFNPSQINTIAWLDAQDQTTITEASGSVSQWDDKSVNARNHTQGIASSQPTTGTNSINGVNAITFDGNDTINNVSYSYTGEYLRFSIIKLDPTITTFKRPWSLTENTNGYSHNLINLGSGSQSFIRARYAGSSTSTAPSAGVDSAFNPFISYSALKNTELSFWSTIDNTKYISDPNSPLLQIDNSFLGSDNSAQNFFGEIGEVIDIPVSEEVNIDKIVGYIAWKWGLVAELDAGHPYKNQPPKV